MSVCDTVNSSLPFSIIPTDSVRFIQYVDGLSDMVRKEDVVLRCIICSTGVSVVSVIIVVSY